MSTTLPPATVVARIQKLLALAGNNSNEHEASAAASKAQTLLTEYNLSLAELGESDEPQAAGDAERVRVEDELHVTKDWQASLMTTLAECNFCYHWLRVLSARRPGAAGSKVRRRRFHALIGRRANVAVTIETYKYLVKAMARLCPAEYGRGERAGISWYTGCTDRLASRLREQRAQAEAASRAAAGTVDRGDGRSLVLADVYGSEDDLNNDFRWGYAPGTTAARRREQEAFWAAEARDTPPVPAAPMTPAELAKAEREAAKAARRDARWWQAYKNRQAREAARVDKYAYAQGSAAGRGIGLDRQVGREAGMPRLS